jgi:hypothetical protein
MRFDYSVIIRRPPPAVFAMLADVQDWGKEERAALVPVMEKITPGPTRVGTRWHEVVQLAPHLTMTVWSEIVAIEQDRLLDERFWAWWMRGRLEYTMTPTDGGTVLRQRERLEPRGPFRLVDGFIARQLGPAIEARLEAIGRMLEAAEGQTSSAAPAT